MSLDIKKAREVLWRRANITYKLDNNQLELYELYKNSNDKMVVWSCSRQIGKSYTLCAIAIQECLKEKNTTVKFLAPTQKMVKTIIKPIMRQLLEDCPEDLRPDYKTADGLYQFKNGSEIQVSGADGGRAENLRGGKAKLILVDEAGFITDLPYIVKSIILPLTTTTKGKIILASTPPKSAGHPFVQFVREAEYEGRLIVKTIYDNPRLTEDDIDGFIKASGGVDSVDFKREYLAQIITDENSAVIPEFNDELRNKIVKEWQRPPFFDGYVSMDIGVKDLTVVLFAYYDFKNDKVVVEDEFVIHGQKFNTQKLAEGIREKENKIFVDNLTLEYIEPYQRVSDTNLTVINDLWQLHGLIFQPTRKDDADSALNNLRIMIASERLVIHPRCVTLIRHLRDAVWAKTRKTYDRSADNGHYDAVDALKYLIRSIHYTRNPYPKGYGMSSRENMFSRNTKSSSPLGGVIKKMVNIKPD
jgi:hypothetical protein